MKTLALLICLNLVLGGLTHPIYTQGGLDQRISELSQQIAEKMSAKQKTTIAVVEFADLEGHVTNFGRFLSEELITRLYETDKFKVVERQLLNKVINEQKLTLTGVVDPTSAKTLGKLLGVDAIVSGTITNLAQSLKVNARLISTETGEIFAVASTEIFKDESVTGLMSKGSAISASNNARETPDPAPNKIASQKVVAKEFVFELNSCKRSNDTITCYLTITNDTLQERQLDVYAVYSSRLFDESGNEYVAKKATLGSRSNYRGDGANELVSKVPTACTIRFEDVPMQASKSTLSVEASSPRLGRFKITFRNVQITN